MTTMRTVRRTILLGVLGLGLALAFAALLLPPARAAVTLVSFEATTDGQRVHLTWETASEIDMIGFYILRADSAAGEYRRIPFGAPTPVFASGGVIGGSYDLWDDAVTSGRTYYYKLEALETTGAAEFFGPVEVTVGTPASATPTRTPTPTPTATATRPTATAAPGTSSPTPRPAIPTSTPTPSPSGPASTSVPIYPSATAAFQSAPTATATFGLSPLSTPPPSGGTEADAPPASGVQVEGTPQSGSVVASDGAGITGGEPEPTAIVLTAPTAIPTITSQARPSATPRPERTVSRRGARATGAAAHSAELGLPLWALLPAGIVGVGAVAACALAIRRLWRGH
jgi:hypothetical protein